MDTLQGQAVLAVVDQVQQAMNLYDLRVALMVARYWAPGSLVDVMISATPSVWGAVAQTMAVQDPRCLCDRRVGIGCETYGVPRAVRTSPTGPPSAPA
jgi:hypothetical protein